MLKFPRKCLLYGCDLSDAAIHKFSSITRLLHRNVTVGKPEDLVTFTSAGKFDVILCSHVLEHVDEDYGVVESFANSLSGNGRLIINLPINEVWRDPNHVRDYTPEGARKLLEKCGLRVDAVKMEDRMTAFNLTYENAKHATLLKRLILRGLRLILALLPIHFVEKKNVCWTKSISSSS